MRPIPARRAGIILALAVALAVSACSAVKLGYSSLPTLAYWWLDGYLAFSDQQAPQVREQLARLQAWHRTQELPQWLDLLARVERLAPGEITPQQACTVVDEARQRIEAVARHAEPDLAAFAAGLQPRQLRHLERRYRSNNETYFQDWLALPVAEQQDKRMRELVERLEMVYGRLDEPQRAVLRRAIADSGWQASRVLAERQRRQKDLLQALRGMTQPGLPVADGRTLLRGTLERALEPPDPGARAWQEAMIQEGCRTFAAVHASTTPAQREQAVRRLRAWQRDLRDLMAQPG